VVRAFSIAAPAAIATLLLSGGGAPAPAGESCPSPADPTDACLETHGPYVPAQALRFEVPGATDAVRGRWEEGRRSGRLAHPRWASDEPDTGNDVVELTLPPVPRDSDRLRLHLSAFRDGLPLAQAESVESVRRPAKRIRVRLGKRHGGAKGRLSFTARREVRARVDLRLRAKPITGHWRIIDTATRTVTAGPGRVRVRKALRRSRHKCFPYLRCRASARGTLSTPVLPADDTATTDPKRYAAGADSDRGTVRTGRPRIRKRMIPYGRKRRREMAAYSTRHYGQRTWHLRNPQTIVEHYTDGPTASSAINTFSVDRPDSEYHELPAPCAHFLIDRDGTIYQLVPVDIRCRHVVGLNWTALGIEHVGFSDAQVMGDHRQLHASLALTGWLRCAFGVPRKYVIGHNESLSSPFYREQVASFRGQTHDDMKPATMRRYRRMLGDC
jgi:N-acetylmuramoyl-L-alanine amidase